MSAVPKIDVERMWSELMAIGAITDPARPYTRRAFSPLFAEGRVFLQQQLEAAGAAVRTDAAGNLIGRLEGTDAALGVIALGSHSDTVPAGGRFDGVAGVIAAVEVIRAIQESGVKLRHTLEVIDFLAEEPSDFGPSCIGSRGISGMLNAGMLAMMDHTGEQLAAAISRVGGDPAQALSAKRDDLAAFLEVHIEQGPVLEARGIDIGVVSSIVGIRRIEIIFTGEAAHAGTAPMNLRKDAGVAGARTLLAVREAAAKLAAIGEGYFVATVGIMEIKPGGSNVVPGHCRLVIDARASARALTERFTEEIDAISMTAAREAGVERTAFEVLTDGVPAQCAPELMAVLKQSAEELGLSTVTMASGAGHDAAFMAKVCPAAMIFIPCRRGLSHHPDEWAEKHEVANGATTLLQAVLALDKKREN